MAEPLAFLLPFDGLQTSSRCWHAFDSDNDNVNVGDSPRLNFNDIHPSYGCGAAAKMAFTPFLNCDSLRTPAAVECRPPQEATLAVASPSEAEVMTTEDARAAGEIFNDKTSTLSAVVAEKTSGADGGDARLLPPVGESRPAGNEEASTSYHPDEVSRRHP